MQRCLALLVVAGVAVLCGGAPAIAAAEKENVMPGLWVQESKHEVRAGNGLLSLAFARVGNRVVLKSFRREPGEVELLSEPDRGDALWEIELHTAGGERLTVRSSGARAGKWKVSAGEAIEITLRWPKVPVGDSHVDVEARVRINPGDPLTHWSLRIKNAPEETLRLWFAAFPIIPNVAGEGAKLAFPMGWGILLDDPLHAGDIGGTYPGMTPAMQFVACWRPGGGLYLGAHDPAAAHKSFVCHPDPDTGHLRLMVYNFPPGMGLPFAHYDLPYDAAVGVFRGDWYAAARIHREWAIRNAPWMAQGELRTRTTTPEWLKEIEVWCVSNGSPQEAVGPMKRFAAYFGAPSGMHWYNWHQIPFDDHYPEYFPAHVGFPEAVAELQAAGIHVMPYINGRLWDPRTASWSAENAEAACTKKEDLKPYEEVYGSGVRLVVMCPYSELWQRKVVSLVDRLIHECGVDGVYIDQISAAPAVLCFDPSHGHPVGGGTFWAEGYRRMLQQARRKLPPGRMLTTEENADPWIDLLDAFLLVNTPPNRGEVIPMFPAVYGGRTITFGFQYVAGDDLQRSLPFRAKMARAFAWGAQLGWVSPAILEAQFAREAEYLRNLAQCRRRAHDFLAFGDMLPAPAVRGVPRVTLDGNTVGGDTYSFALPAVIASAWKAANGDVGIALTNMTDEEQTPRVNLSRTQLGLPRGRSFELTRITGAGEQPGGVLAGGRLVIEEKLPPRSAEVIRIHTSERPGV